MTRWTLDGCELQLEPDASFGELLDHLEEGRVLRRIEVDGRELEDFQSAASFELPAGAERVEAVSIPTRDYLRELTLGAPAHLIQVGRVLVEASSFYRQNLPIEGAKRLHSALVGLDALTRLAGSLTEQADAVPEPAEADPSSSPTLTALGKALERVIDCQERNDAAELAGVLESELLPELPSLAETLEALARKLEA